MEQLDYSLIFRLVRGPGSRTTQWDPTVYTKNRERLLNQEVAQLFFVQVKRQAAS